MKTLKKLAIAGALASSLAMSMSANALGPYFDAISGIQLNPIMHQAFQNPGNGVTFAGMQFIVRGPASCVNNLPGYGQTCHVALDHVGRHHGYLLTVTPYVQPKTKHMMTEINAYPDYETVVLTYTKPFLAGTALDIIDVRNIESI